MKKITVEIVINASVAKVWECWTKPEHITKWAFASESWEAPYAENDVRVGGKFVTQMSAKDKSESFEFGGVYTSLLNQKYIEYKMEDGRQVSVKFDESTNGVKTTQSFDPESENSLEMQRAGWQAILDNFKKYVEKE